MVTASKEQAAKAFLKWFSSLANTHITVFSDDSRSLDGAVGYSYAIYRDKALIAPGKGRLG